MNELIEKVKRIRDRFFEKKENIILVVIAAVLGFLLVAVLFYNSSLRPQVEKLSVTPSPTVSPTPGDKSTIPDIGVATPTSQAQATVWFPGEESTVAHLRRLPPDSQEVIEATIVHQAWFPPVVTAYDSIKEDDVQEAIATQRRDNDILKLTKLLPYEDDQLYIVPIFYGSYIVYIKGNTSQGRISAARWFESNGIRSVDELDIQYIDY